MTLSSILQLAVDGLINGSQYALYGAGFALVLGVTGRFHYAYALVFTVCAYVTSVLQTSVGGPFALLVLAGLAAAALTGVLCEAVIYRPLARGSGPVSLLTVFVAALGVTIAGVNLIVLLFGEQSRTLRAGRGSHVTHLGGLTITTLEAASVVIAWALIGALAAVLQYTQFGRMVRATRVNPEMSAVVGIATGRVYLWVFAVGSLLAGVGAIIYGLRFAVTPDMGSGRRGGGAHPAAAAAGEGHPDRPRPEFPHPAGHLRDRAGGHDAAAPAGGPARRGAPAARAPVPAPARRRSGAPCPGAP